MKKIGKKSKTLLALLVFSLFAFFDINLHNLAGFFLAGIILFGLAIWLRVWREPKKIYSRLKRAIYTIGFLTMITSIFWLMHGLDILAFGFMVSLLLTLFGLFVYVKKKYHIVEFKDLSSQQKQHEDFVMKNYSFFPYSLFVDKILSNPKHAAARNRIAVANFKRNIDKGQKLLLFEKLFPLVMLAVIILFATGILK